MSNPQKKIYVCDRDNVVQGPFSAEELSMLYSSNKFSDQAQVNFSGEWEPLEPVAEAIMNHLTQLARETELPIQRGLTLLDVMIPAVLWWCFYKVEWPAIAGLAVAVTAWTVGQVIAMVSHGVLRWIGQLTQGFGGMVGIPAILWLVWTLISKFI